MLTAGQLAAFEAFGFLKLGAVFSTREMGDIRREFDDVLAEDREGRRFTGEERQMVQSFVERRAALSTLIDDDRIYGPMEQVLGPDLVWLTSDGNLYVGDTDWHHDATVKGYPQIKVALYLDPVRRDTGCLRVIPGSHEPPYHYALDPLSSQDEPGFGVARADVPCAYLESEPGDVVMFHQTMWHATFGGGAGRRMLALSYAPYPATDAHAAYLRSLYAAVVVKGHSREPFLKSGRPRLEGMVSRLKALGLED
jgi:hypothetical protein